MRGLGEALHEQGWSVCAPLLPGFGSDIQTLTSRRWPEWLVAAERAAAGLRAQGHGPLLVVGYSMGAALSLIGAHDGSDGESGRPDGLALIAPFAFPEPWWVGPAEFLIRPFLPLSFSPMRKADFTSEQLRRGITNFIPDLDLDDPDVQAAIRGFRVPLGLIDQLRAVSRGALTAAGKAGVPVLVIQGTRDAVSRPAWTRRLIDKLPQRPVSVEVDSDHNLTDPAAPAWPAVRRAVLDFAADIAARTR
jgi:carboxylesterase